MKKLRILCNARGEYSLVLYNGERVPYDITGKFIPDGFVLVYGKFVFREDDVLLGKTPSGYYYITSKPNHDLISTYDGKMELREFVSTLWDGRLFSNTDTENFVTFAELPRQLRSRMRHMQGRTAHVSECAQCTVTGSYFLLSVPGGIEANPDGSLAYAQGSPKGYIAPFVEGRITRDNYVMSQKHSVVFADRFIALLMGYFEFYGDLHKYDDPEVVDHFDKVVKAFDKTLASLSISRDNLIRLDESGANAVKNQFKRELERMDLSEGYAANRAGWKRFPRIGHPANAGNDIRFRCGMEVEKEDRAALSRSFSYVLFHETGWYLEKDGSLDSESGYELISPILDLSKADEIRAMMNEPMLKMLINASYSNKCGGHIHVSDSERTPVQLLEDMSGYFPLLYAMYSSRAKQSAYTRALPKDEYLLHRTGQDKAAIMPHGNVTLEFRIFPSPRNTTVQYNRLRFLYLMMTNPRRSYHEVFQDLTNESSLLYQFLDDVYDVDEIQNKVVTSTKFAEQFDAFRTREDSVIQAISNFDEFIRAKKKSPFQPRIEI